MTLPVQGSFSLILAVLFGAVFGMLLQRGRVADYNTIVNQFRFKDFTVLRVMLSAIVTGGIGVWILHGLDLAAYHIKPADLVSVGLGAVIFGIGMVLYGYCPGTGIAAVGTGRVDALIGFLGMLTGGILYALSYSWVSANLTPLLSYGKVRLPEVSGIGDGVWLSGLLVGSLAIFFGLRKLQRSESAERE